MKNAKHKAYELAQCLHAKLGQALNIEEEAVSEWEGPPADNNSLGADDQLSVQNKMALATAHVIVTVKATFELLSKVKVKLPV